MSTTYITTDQRRLVVARARNVCEYCLANQSDFFLRFQIDHVISEKHGGATSLENLALSCTYCNSRKGSDIATLSTAGELTRLFNPRLDTWNMHFRFDEARAEILGLSDIGLVTCRMLGFNHYKRVTERMQIMLAGRYPSSEAIRIMRNEELL